MNLQPGCRFLVAPRFPLSVHWPERLLIAPGVVEEDGCFYPMPGWRPPTADELAVLVPAVSTPGAAAELDAAVCLFQLPDHLRLSWWKLLEANTGTLGTGPLQGFDLFADQVDQFLDFKGLPVPAHSRHDVVVSSPGARSLHGRSATNTAAGLRCSVAPWTVTDEPRGPKLWGALNLGDEDTSLVVVNLSRGQLAAALRRRFPDQPVPETVGALSRHFLQSCADYPLVRLVLKPGEGYRLPVGGLIFDGSMLEKQEPDVVLLISPE